ncbi:MAG TPA: hypothetical protein VLC09_22170 [Polyangiaceae bacterium]|nr:hypothetical protein [Polyangiaceae bacterium]
MGEAYSESGARRDGLLACPGLAEFVTCPFCRELFLPGEASRCPTCDLPLVSSRGLPPSLDAQALSPEPLVDPLDRPRGPWFWRRGRGASLGLSALGLALFFAPWLHMERPESIALSGFDLARTHLVYLWGGAIGWFLGLPLAWTRQTIYQLRGARVILATFAAMTTIECALLALFPPRDYLYFRAQLSLAPGLVASCVVSVLAIAVNARLGGSAADFRDLGVDTPATRSPGDAVH